MHLYRIGTTDSLLSLCLLESVIAYPQASFNLLKVLAGGIFFFPNTQSVMVELLETKSRSTFLRESAHNKQRAQTTVFF